MTRIDLQKIDTGSIKRVLTELGSPIIPLTLVFESLGYGGATGLEWGILAGAVSALAIELGYEVRRMGRSIVLVKRRTAPKKKRIPA